MKLKNMKGFVSYECTLGCFSNVGESLALLKDASLPEAISFSYFLTQLKLIYRTLMNIQDPYFYQLCVSIVER